MLDVRCHAVLSAANTSYVCEDGFVSMSARSVSSHSVSSRRHVGTSTRAHHVPLKSVMRRHEPNARKKSVRFRCGRDWKLVAMNRECEGARRERGRR